MFDIIDALLSIGTTKDDARLLKFIKKGKKPWHGGE